MNYLRTLSIGLVMGACDVVPGVSGGTIAFISGIYEKLLESIRACTDPITRKYFFRGEFLKARTIINGTFLFVLFVGIGISILLFSQLLHGLLETDPHLIWGFFGGLVVASIVILIQKQKGWTTQQTIGLLVGAAVAYTLTQVSPTEVVPHRWMIVLSASIAICAMILPGVSGSFLLLVLGMYGHVITALSEGDIVFLALFVGGMVVGLMSFVHVVTHFLHNYHNTTIAVLVGFIIGALPKLRPRQNPVETIVDRHGDELVVQTQSVLPIDYIGNPETIFVLLLFIIGLFGSLFVLQYIHRDGHK